MNNFNNIDGLFTSAFLVSLTLAKDLTSEEQILLGNYLQIVGLNLASYATFYELFGNNELKNSEN